MTFSVQQEVTQGGDGFATLCGVAKWQTLEGLHERIRWSRQRAGYDRPVDAARSLNIKPGTYRTYEAPKGDGGREPPLTEIQRIARKFKVNWIWLATGDGSPDEGQVIDERVAEIGDKVAKLPKADQDTALNAALSVVDAFAKRAG